MTGVIYGLHNGDGVIRYIGQTIRSARTRLQQHLSEARRGNRYNTAFLNWLRMSDVEYVILYTGEELDEQERYWITVIPNLFNRFSGGVRGFKVPEDLIEERTKRIIAFNKRGISGERNPFYGHKHSEATKDMIRGELNPMAKLTAAEVEEIRYRQLQGEKQITLAREYGVGPMQISRIVHGKRWSS